MKHTVLEQSSFQNYTLLTFVQTDVHRQATYCCLLMTKAKVNRLLCKAQAGCCYEQMTASSCQGRSTSKRRAAKVVLTYSNTHFAGIQLPYLQHGEDTAWGTRTTSFSWEWFSARFPKPMSLCKDALLACHQSTFSKISYTATGRSVVFIGKRQGATRPELVGKEAWFVPEEPLAFGKGGEDVPHTILPNQRQICAPSLFSCWTLDQWRSQRHWAPLHMASHEPPTSFYSKGLRLNSTVGSSENSSLPRGEGGGGMRMLWAASPGLESSSAGCCVPACRIAT